MLLSCAFLVALTCFFGWMVLQSLRAGATPRFLGWSYTRQTQPILFGVAVGIWSFIALFALAFLGLVITLPIPTHAVTLDLPPP